MGSRERASCSRPEDEKSVVVMADMLDSSMTGLLIIVSLSYRATGEKLEACKLARGPTGLSQVILGEERCLYYALQPPRKPDVCQ